MDVHRCRFVPYPLSAINTLAFSHDSNPHTKGKVLSNVRLAIGRANGDIEIWNPFSGNWYQETILRGSKDRSIEGLVWIKDPDEEVDGVIIRRGRFRLFSIGYSTAITEWDLALGRPLRHSTGNYGDIWCLAVQPWKAPIALKKQSVGKEESRKSPHLVAGCADGTLVLHSTADHDLRFLRTLARSSSKKARVLSVAFQNREVIVAGYADSMIRIFSFHNGQQINSMSLSAGPRGGPSEVLVWTVRCLPNGTIVSGDSTGEVKFWDGRTFTLVQRIQSHKSDILDLVANTDGTIVFSGGMDRRTTMYRQTTNWPKRTAGRWAEIGHSRIHSHDIKAMAAFETREMSVVASGGLDTSPTIIPLREFKMEHYRALPSLPHLSPLQSAPRKRLVMSWWDREVRIWQISRSPHSSRGDGDYSDVEGPAANKLVSRILVQGEENLTSVALSTDGSVLAASTISEVKVFGLRDSKSAKKGALKLQKLKLPQHSAMNGAKIVQISPDSKWLLVIRLDNMIQLYRVIQPRDIKGKLQFLTKPAVLQRLSRASNEGITITSHGDYGKAISRVAFSADSRILVVADLSGFLDSWVLEGHEDLTQEADGVEEERVRQPDYDSDEDMDEESHPHVIFGQHWIRNPTADVMPKLPSTPLILSFRPANPSAVSTSTNGHSIVHPTRHNPHPHSHDLPNGEDRLFILTAHNHIYEYEILAGKLSNWSRRNPPAHLPRKFKDILDRAMGVVWDISGDRERIWLYGSTWLFMFDLSRDFPDGMLGFDGVPTGPTGGIDGKKRERDDGYDPEEAHDRKRSATGAGKRIAAHRLDAGMSRTFLKSQGSDQHHAQRISTEARVASSDGDDNVSSEDDATVHASTLVSLRRGGKEVTSNSHDGELLDTDGEPNVGEGDARRWKGGPAQWYTFQYRPILGIVPLGGEDDEGLPSERSSDHEDFRRGIEVALVERPSWDEDLPARFYGDQEWNK